ncbi:disrupted in schizophrenia 1 protein isoform X2 [Hoplias malabaricus]|uniref:disrupted in schizophrenia 1 protein isoform X2 n=1 Tax=Hoplias malabaricus TaxID=27720 RepID=UPI0034619431
MMFAGMIRMEATTDNYNRRCAALREGGLLKVTDVDVSCKNNLRRSEYVLVKLAKHLDYAPGLAGNVLYSNCEDQASCPSAWHTSKESSVKLPKRQGHHGEHSVRRIPCLPYKNISGSQCCGNYQLEPSCEPISPNVLGSSEDTASTDIFNSSFSFIQESLDSERSFWGLCASEINKETLSHQSKLKSTGGPQSVLCLSENVQLSKGSFTVGAVGSDNLSVDHIFFTSDQSGKRENLLQNSEILRVEMDVPWHTSNRDSPFSMTSHSRNNMPDEDRGSLDTEVTSFLSLDSLDSSSSLTSGYESTTPSSDQKWDVFMNKCEEVMQECLHENHTNSRVESRMFKLQRMQQKAVLDDDYDTAERISKKLDELMKEQASLRPGLPSKHPKISCFLEQLRTTVQKTLQRMDSKSRQQEPSECHMGPEQSREQLLKEKEHIQKEIAALQHKLEELQKWNLALEAHLNQKELRLETVELERTLLRGCSPSELHLTGQVLEDLLTSKHRVKISLSPLSCIDRLQDQQQALTLSIKEATAKVVMSQRLGGSLRRKVSESETQLLALHEAKLAAISGNDFIAAKEIKAEMKSVYGEREHLEGILKRLQILSAGSAQELARKKEQHRQLKKELQMKEAQYEQDLKENIVKYTEFLENRLHRCGNPVLERIWEADLEACYLFLSSFQLHDSTYSEPEDLPPSPKPCPHVQPFSKTEADCAMLTALGGCWGPEANLQNSEFTKTGHSH